MSLLRTLLLFSFCGNFAIGLTGCATGGHSSPSSQAASTPEEDAESLFVLLDVDGNGKISREEARAGFKYLIASYDRGGGSTILAAKPGGSTDTAVKRKAKRRPTSQDAKRAFEALFEKQGATSNEISKDEFRKLIVKSSDNPDTDPFVAFY